jgi:hypothetical protein
MLYGKEDFMKKVYGFGMAALMCASLFVMGGCPTEAEPDIGGGPAPSALTWTAVTVPGFGGDISGIAYGGPAGQEKFVAVGDSGKAAYSADGGVSWTAGTDTGSSGWILGIAYGGPAGQERFVAVGGRDGDRGHISYSNKQE